MKNLSAGFTQCFIFSFLLYHIGNRYVNHFLQIFSGNTDRAYKKRHDETAMPLLLQCGNEQKPVRSERYANLCQFSEELDGANHLAGVAVLVVVPR
ncbi:hypothetical protein, partial [Ruminococcus callidus]|uniref:hypothetical protein n=1 Tax=Ruminococcus callidus TaxID=40519 RepID=UPI003996437D